MNNKKMTLYTIKGMMLEINEKMGEIFQLQNGIIKLIGDLDLDDSRINNSNEETDTSEDSNNNLMGNQPNFSGLTRSAGKTSSIGQERLPNRRQSIFSPSARVLRRHVVTPSRYSPNPPALPPRSRSPSPVRKKENQGISYPFSQQGAATLNMLFPNVSNTQNNVQNEGEKEDICIEVASETTPNLKYTINLNKGECSCPDFKYHGPKKCKHLKLVMENPNNYGLSADDLSLLKSMYN